MEWKEVLLSEFLEFNPKRTIKKNEVARKITMDLLIPHSKQIYSFKYEPYTGGAKFSNGDTIMARITPCLENGKHAYVSCLNEGEIAYGSTEYIVLCGKNGVSDNEFVYYLSHTPQFVNTAIKSMVGSSGRQRAQVPVLENLIMPVPVNLSDQRKIAGILSALDSKIENNNKINANLEAQAQALFKSWFVDFTPFKDQPFVDSELGPIPQGWKVGKLGDYVEIKRGGSPRPIQKFLTSQGLNWLKISDATSTQSPFIFNIKEKIIINGLKKTVFLKAGSLVLSNSATPCIPKFLSIDSCIHDGWLYFPHSQLPKNYLYLFFKLMRNNLVSKANGSVFLNLKTDIVKNQVFAFSGEEIYNSFDKIIAPLFKEIENLTYETFQLSALRDTLLPKLMSGEIKL